MQNNPEEYIAKIQIEDIIDVIRLSTKKRSKKKKVPEKFFQQLASSTMEWEKIFKIKTTHHGFDCLTVLKSGKSVGIIF